MSFWSAISKHFHPIPSHHENIMHANKKWAKKFYYCHKYFRILNVLAWLSASNLHVHTFSSVLTGSYTWVRFIGCGQIWRFSVFRWSRIVVSNGISLKRLKTSQTNKKFHLFLADEWAWGYYSVLLAPKVLSHPWVLALKINRFQSSSTKSTVTGATSKSIKKSRQSLSKQDNCLYFFNIQVYWLKMINFKSGCFSNIVGLHLWYFSSDHNDHCCLYGNVR